MLDYTRRGGNGDTEMSQHNPVGNCTGVRKPVFKFALGVLLAENSGKIARPFQTSVLSSLK